MFSWFPLLSVYDHRTSERPKREKRVTFLAEWLFLWTVRPPAVSRPVCSARPCWSACCRVRLTDKNWKNMGAIRCQDSGDLPFLCLPKKVPVQIYILHVLIWIKCSPISIIFITSDRVTLIPAGWEMEFLLVWFAFFLYFLTLFLLKHAATCSQGCIFKMQSVCNQCIGL